MEREKLKHGLRGNICKSHLAMELYLDYIEDSYNSVRRQV